MLEPGQVNPGYPRPEDVEYSVTLSESVWEWIKTRFEVFNESVAAVGSGSTGFHFVISDVKAKFAVHSVLLLEMALNVLLNKGWIRLSDPSSSGSSRSRTIKYAVSEALAEDILGASKKRKQEEEEEEAQRLAAVKSEKEMKKKSDKDSSGSGKRLAADDDSESDTEHTKENDRRRSSSGVNRGNTSASSPAPVKKKRSHGHSSSSSSSSSSSAAALSPSSPSRGGGEANLVHSVQQIEARVFRAEHRPSFACALPQQLVDTIMQSLIVALLGTDGAGVPMSDAFQLMFLQDISRADFYTALEYLERLNRVWVDWSETDRDNQSIIYQV